MKRSFIFLMAVLFFGFCGSSLLAQVKSDYDKTVDFSKYKTYSFAGWQQDSDKQMNELDKKRIHEAFREEFSKRGMEYKESGADAIITLFLVLESKTSKTAYTTYTGGYGYGPRWGWGVGYGYGYGVGMGSAYTTYSEYDYLEGTLVIDMYDDQSKSLVWQGIITKVVQDNPKKREKTIPKGIRKLMYSFPVKPQK